MTPDDWTRLRAEWQAVEASGTLARYMEEHRVRRFAILGKRLVEEALAVAEADSRAAVSPDRPDYAERALARSFAIGRLIAATQAWDAAERPDPSPEARAATDAATAGEG